MYNPLILFPLCVRGPPNNITQVMAAGLADCSSVQWVRSTKLRCLASSVLGSDGISTHVMESLQFQANNKNLYLSLISLPMFSVLHSAGASAVALSSASLHH